MPCILAEKQTVSCDFEDTFICGYTTSTAGTISWKRVSSKTIGFNGLSEGKHGQCF